VLVIPHGFDPELFNIKTESQRQSIRDERRLSCFLFVNVSGLSDNKGIDLLLSAFARVLKKHPNSKLCIKGSDAVYRSKEQMGLYLERLGEHDRKAVIEKLVYVGNQVSNAEMANLYNCADAYVCPYRCEGFNIPALEAAACGLPVIFTKGGPTDEFLNPSYHLPISSAERITDNGSHYLDPDLDDLTLQMISAIENKIAHRERAKLFAPELVKSHSWDKISEKLFLEIKNRC